jgi:hypothetical protein
MVLSKFGGLPFQTGSQSSITQAKTGKYSSLLKQVARHQTRARIFKRLWSPGIDSNEKIPPDYVARRAGTITLFQLA